MPEINFPLGILHLCKLACTGLLQINGIKLVRMQFSKQHKSNSDHLPLEPEQLVLHQLYRN